MVHGSTAATVRIHKDQNPERYCTDARCLWRTKNWNHLTKQFEDNPCPKHSGGAK